MNARTIHPGFITAVWLLPALALLQVSFAGHVAVRGAIPGIMLVTVVDWGILRGMDEGVIWAFVGGVLLDGLSGYPFGTNTVALVLVASAVSLGRGTFIRTHALLPLATVFAATLLYYLVVLFILESTHHPVDWLVTLRSIALPIAIYNALLNLGAFPLLRRLEEKVYPMPRANW